MLKFNSVLLLTLITCLTTAAHGDLIAHFPLDSDGDSKDGLFVAALNENVTYGESGANGNTGTSALFNGSTSRIQHPWNESLNPTNFSVTVWALSNAGAGSWNSPVTSRFSSISTVWKNRNAPARRHNDCPALPKALCGPYVAW